MAGSLVVRQAFAALVPFALGMLVRGGARRWWERFCGRKTCISCIDGYSTLLRGCCTLQKMAIEDHGVTWIPIQPRWPRCGVRCQCLSGTRAPLHNSLLPVYPATIHALPFHTPGAPAHSYRTTSNHSSAASCVVIAGPMFDIDYARASTSLLFSGG